MVVKDDSADTFRKKVLPPKSGNQKIVWEAIQLQLSLSDVGGMAGAPAGSPCVRLDDVIEKIKNRLPCEPKRQTERTKNAILGLVSRGLLEHRDGWLWLA